MNIVMRILFVTNSLGAFGGIEKVTIVKANAFADMPDTEVGIAYTDKGIYPEKTIEPISEKVKIFDLGVSFWDLSSMNMKSLLITFPKKFFALRRNIKKLIKEFNPDIVISTGQYEKFALASMRLKSIAKIREYHFSSTYRRFIDGVKYIRIAEWIDNKFLPRFFDRSYLLTKEDKETNFPKNNRFDFQHNPCTIKTIRPIDVYARENVVLIISRLVHQKNISLALKVWEKASPKMPSWRLVIVGSGNEASKLQALAEELNISDKVHFMGYRQDIPNILSSAKMLLSTSRYEGLPLNIVEAMSYGVVPIAHKFQYGASDIINNGIDGFVVSYNDEDQMAEKLICLANSSDKLLSMSENAIKRSKDFDQQKIVSEYMEKLNFLK